MRPGGCIAARRSWGAPPEAPIHRPRRRLGYRPPHTLREHKCCDTWGYPRDEWERETKNGGKNNPLEPSHKINTDLILCGYISGMRAIQAGRLRERESGRGVVTPKYIFKKWLTIFQLLIFLWKHVGPSQQRDHVIFKEDWSDCIRVNVRTRIAFTENTISWSSITLYACET